MLHISGTKVAFLKLSIQDLYLSLSSLQSCLEEEEEEELPPVVVRSAEELLLVVAEVVPEEDVVEHVEDAVERTSLD